MLVEFYIMKANGARMYPFGKGPNGLLIYNKDGYMSAILTRENQPNEVALDFKNTSAEEHTYKTAPKGCYFIIRKINLAKKVLK